MFLYWLASENRYVHRQSDIPKGVDSERVDVPTDTAGLMAYLNNLVLNRGKPLDHPAPGEQLLTSPEPVTLGDPCNCAVVTTAKDAAQVLATGAGVAFEGEPGIVLPQLPEQPRRALPMDAGAILSRIDNPGVEGVVEAIGKAKGYALRRYAGAVAIRFQELEKL